MSLYRLSLFYRYTLLYFLNFNCYSVTVVCLFFPSLYPTPAKPTSSPHLHPPPWLCPCSCNPLSSPCFRLLLLTGLCKYVQTSQWEGWLSLDLPLVIKKKKKGRSANGPRTTRAFEHKQNYNIHISVVTACFSSVSPGKTKGQILMHSCVRVFTQ